MADDFDPDRMNADDIDPEDFDAVMAWLDHPNTEAMTDDLGRAFRHEPADVQRASLQQLIDTNEPRLQELDEALATRDHTTPEARVGLEQLRATMQQMLDSARLRLLELDEQ